MATSDRWLATLRCARGALIMLWAGVLIGVSSPRRRIWDEAARHYDEPALAALTLSIATTNVFNRPNVPTRQVAGAAWS